MHFKILDQTDSYKLGHWDMMPAGTQRVWSYLESRFGAAHAFVIFMGLQPILLDKLAGNVVSQADIDAAYEMAQWHFGDKSVINKEGWEYIANDLGGRLPVEIRAVPEGTAVPTSNILASVVNTDDDTEWLTNYIESTLTHVWYPTTVATLSRSVRQMIERYLEATGCDLAAADFMLHDFGYRGATSNEAAAMGGAAHLVNFKGTDTIVAMALLRDFYNQVDPSAFSVRATEHSVMTALGNGNDIAVLDELLAKYDTGILSVVADSYDIYKFVQAVCDRAELIKSRPDFKLVGRPDSLTPADKTHEALTLNIMSTLAETFGGTKTDTNHLQLDPHIGVLWGDGIGPDGIEKILQTLQWAGFAASNMVFGMGGGLLQRDINRDTERFAFKCSAQYRDDEWYDIQKKPLDASKVSKTGRLALVEGEDGVLTTVQGPREDDILETVFLDGEVTKMWTLDEIRERANETSKAFA